MKLGPTECGEDNKQMQQLGRHLAPLASLVRGCELLMNGPTMPTGGGTITRRLRCGR